MAHRTIYLLLLLLLSSSPVISDDPDEEPAETPDDGTGPDPIELDDPLKPPPPSGPIGGHWSSALEAQEACQFVCARQYPKCILIGCAPRRETVMNEGCQITCCGDTSHKFCWNCVELAPGDSPLPAPRDCLPSESEQNVEAKAVEKPPAPPTSPNVESPMDPVKGVANSIDNYLAGATPKVSPTAASNVNAASTPSSPPSAGALPGSETPLPSSGVAPPGSDAPLPGGSASPPSSGGTLPPSGDAAGAGATPNADAPSNDASSSNDGKHPPVASPMSTKASEMLPNTVGKDTPPPPTQDAPQYDNKGEDGSSSSPAAPDTPPPSKNYLDTDAMLKAQ
jgi:hypothetical protein